MSSSQPAGSTPSPFGPPRATPHIRLNSGVDNILENPHQQQNKNQRTSRSLTHARPQRPSIKTQGLYQQNRQAGESSELLLPPRSQGRGYHDEDSPVSPTSPTSPPSANSSRRSSWSSGYGAESPVGGPFVSPFDDPQSRAVGAEGIYVNTQTVADKYNIAPSNGLLIFPEDVEKDDWLHNPDPTEKDGNDCDIWSKRGCANIGGLTLLTLGLVMVFIGYPAL
jgi:beta-glucan synthesis-associated protein KRE6